MKMLVIQALLAAAGPMMAVGGSGGKAEPPEPILLVVTNNGERALTVEGAKDGNPIDAHASADVRLDDARDLVVSFEESGKDGEDNRAMIEVANKCGAVLVLRADGKSHTISPGGSLSLTINDVDTIALENASAGARESVAGQAGSADEAGAAERSNSAREGPEGDAAAADKKKDVSGDFQEGGLG